MDLQVRARRDENYFETRNTGLLDLPFEVIEYILPHLPPHSLFALSLVSKAFYNLIFPPSGSSQCTRIWRHLSLADPKGYNSRSLVPAKKLKAYLRTPEVLLSKPYVLQHTRTLILDGSPAVTVPLISTLLLEDGINQSHRIEILSIRACPEVNDQELAISLRSMSDKIAPRLKGIYYFSDPALDHAPSLGVSEFVSSAMTKLLGLACRTRDEAEARRGGWWAVTMQALSGRISFDAELCRGNDHYVQREGRPRLCLPKITTMRISEGCGECGVCPSSEEFVEGVSGLLYPPVPLHSSSVARAMSTCHFAVDHNVRTTLLCTACLSQRYCKGCAKWWCAPCSMEPAAVDFVVPKPFVRLDCFECGYMCGDCNRGHSRSCHACSGHYCIIHNDGSDEQLCEWCNLSSYQNRKRRASISKVADRSKVHKATLASSAAGPSRSPLTEVDRVLQNTAYFSDPAGMISGSGAYVTTTHASSSSSSTAAAIPRTSPSPYLSATLAPVIMMGSSSTAAPTIAAEGKGKQSAATEAAVHQHQQQQPTTPNLKPVGVGKAAGMRLRTMVVLGKQAATDKRWLSGRSGRN